MFTAVARGAGRRRRDLPVSRRHQPLVRPARAAANRRGADGAGGGARAARRSRWCPPASTSIGRPLFRSRVTVVYGAPFVGSDLLPASDRELAAGSAGADRQDCGAHARAPRRGGPAGGRRAGRSHRSALRRGPRPAVATRTERLARRRTIAAGIDRLRADAPERYDELLLQTAALRPAAAAIRHPRSSSRLADQQRRCGRVCGSRVAVRPRAAAAERSRPRRVLRPLPAHGRLPPRLSTTERDVIATAQVLTGAAIYAAWVAALHRLRRGGSPEPRRRSRPRCCCQCLRSSSLLALEREAAVRRCGAGLAAAASGEPRHPRAPAAPSVGARRRARSGERLAEQRSRQGAVALTCACRSARIRLSGRPIHGADPDVTAITEDSRRVEPGTLFVAVPRHRRSTATRTFRMHAARGAVAIAAERARPRCPADVAEVRVTSLAPGARRIRRALLRLPRRRLASSGSPERSARRARANPARAAGRRRRPHRRARLARRHAIGSLREPSGRPDHAGARRAARGAARLCVDAGATSGHPRGHEPRAPAATACTGCASTAGCWPPSCPASTPTFTARTRTTSAPNVCSWITCAPDARARVRCRQPRRAEAGRRWHASRSAPGSRSTGARRICSSTTSGSTSRGATFGVSGTVRRRRFRGPAAQQPARTRPPAQRRRSRSPTRLRLVSRCAAARDVLASLRPLRRRMERYDVGGRTVLDDTAAHPDSFHGHVRRRRHAAARRSRRRLRACAAIEAPISTASTLARSPISSRATARRRSWPPASDDCTSDKDRATPEEVDATRQALAERGARASSGTTRCARPSREAMDRTEPGDLIVLVGAQGMDDGKELIGGTYLNRQACRPALRIGEP